MIEIKCTGCGWIWSPFEGRFMSTKRPDCPIHNWWAGWAQIWKWLALAILGDA